MNTSPGKQKITKHAHKPHEWIYEGKKRSEIVALLKNYKESFLIECWTEKVLYHFLELYHHLYPEPIPQQHHVRAIATIITEAGL